MLANNNNIESDENGFDELQVNNICYNEDSICLVNKWISTKGMVFQAWAHQRAIKLAMGDA